MGGLVGLMRMLKRPSVLSDESELDREDPKILSSLKGQDNSDPELQPPDLPKTKMLDLFRENAKNFPERQHDSFGHNMAGIGLSMLLGVNPLRRSDVEHNEDLKDYQVKNQNLLAGAQQEESERSHDLGWVTHLAGIENQKEGNEIKRSEVERKSKFGDEHNKLQQQMLELKAKGQENTKEYQDKMVRIRNIEANASRDNAATNARNATEHGRHNKAMEGKTKAPSISQYNAAEKHAILEHLIQNPEDSAVLSKFHRGEDLSDEEKSKLAGIYQNAKGEAQRRLTGTGPNDINLDEGETENDDDDFSFSIK